MVNKAITDTQKELPIGSVWQIRQYLEHDLNSFGEMNLLSLNNVSVSKFGTFLFIRFEGISKGFLSISSR